MNGYVLWYLCIAILALFTLSRAGRIFGAGFGVWRGRLAELLVRNVLIGIGFPLLAEWLIVFVLIATPPDALEAPADGFMAVMSVIVAIVGIVGAVRETRAWIAWIRNYRGNWLMRARRYSEALTVYERLTRRYPKIGGFWVSKSVALSSLGCGLEALAAIERALALRPKQVDGLMWKANVLVALQQDAAALDTLDRALRLRPDVGRTWERKAYVCVRLGRYAEALAAWEWALALEAKNTRHRDAELWGLAQATLATALNGLGRSVEALAVAERAIPFNPYPVRSQLAKAIALERLGRPEEARVTAEQGLGVAERYLADEPSALMGAEVWPIKAAMLRLLGRAGEADAAEARSQALYAAIRGECEQLDVLL